MRRDLAVPGVAPMTVPIFLSWGVWDAVLLASCLLVTHEVAARRGQTVAAALLGGTLAWLFFPLFWLALVNMGLAQPRLLLATLPLSWLEFAVTAVIFVTVRRTRGGAVLS